MDKSGMISVKEQVVDDLPLDEKVLKKKCSKVKVALIASASFVCAVLLLWFFIGAPLPGTMASCEEHSGIRYLCENGNNVDQYFLIQYAITEDGEFCRSGIGAGSGYSCWKPTTRIILTPWNFDMLLPARVRSMRFSNGQSYGASVRKNYSSAWVVSDPESNNGQYYIYILLDNGYVVVAKGSSFLWKPDGNPQFDSVFSLTPRGNIQEFYEYVGE